jgi:hypothetical protein
MCNLYSQGLCIIEDSRGFSALVWFASVISGGTMDLFLREAADRIGDDDVLSKIDALIDWQAISPILTRGLGRSGIGPQATTRWCW